MPTLPWRSFNIAGHEREYVILLSYLPLRQSLRIPQFLLHTSRIAAQLAKAAAFWVIRCEPSSGRNGFGRYLHGKMSWHCKPSYELRLTLRL